MSRSDNMLKSKAKWNFLDNNETKNDDKHNSVIEQLFISRNLYEEHDREKFLKPNLEDIQSPTNFRDISLVKERIENAITHHEKVIVYGDYDADGVTATTVLVTTLLKLGVDCHYYIPNRFTEGYGLNEPAIEHFAEQNVALIITVDTGIANVSEVQLANDLGIDVIITDHHEVQETIPNAYAIIHPLLSEDYSYKHLAGVGVAWQVASYLIGEPPTELLDLVAIGTVADLVPLTGENRILVYEGLKRLNKTESIGLNKLIERAKINSQLTERDIGFGIGPRLNAVGRLQDSTLAVELLLTKDEHEADAIANEIEELNAERQKIVQSIVKEAEKRVNEKDLFIVLADETWHEGVLGIAASRLVNTFHRPVMLLTAKEGTNEWKGSARSVRGFNLFENCIAIKHMFTSFGGHSQAAGMTFPKDNLEKITANLIEQMEKNFTGTIGLPELTIDQTIHLDDMTEQLVYEIMSFAPFGIDNEKPLFHVAAKPTQVRQLGQDKQHLKLQFHHGDRIVEAIGFQLGNLAHYIAQDSTVSLVGELQLNEWNGKVTVQMNIKDMAIEEWQLFDYRGKRHISNLLPYVNQYDHNIVVCNEIDEVKELDVYDNVQFITYDSELGYLSETELLYVYDLPNNLQQLKTIVELTNPESIHVSYQVTEDAFLQTIPNREQFKKVYEYIATFSPVDLKQHYPNMIKTLRLRKEYVSFILKVFYDLHFITVENNVVKVNRHAKKAELTESKTYQQRVKQSEVEKILYYSTQQELKEWFLQQTERIKGEEITHEL